MLDLSTKINFKKGIANAHLDLGLNYSATNNSEKTLHHYQLALKRYEEIDDMKGYAAVLTNLSLMYMDKGDFTNALDYGFKALTIYEGSGDTKSMAIQLENVGTAYLQLKEIPKAIEYYDKALHYYRTLNNEVGVARNLGNQAIIYNEQGDYEMALKYLNSAYEVNKKRGAKSSMQMNLANMGIAYEKQNKFKTALNYHLQALALSKEIKDKQSIAINYGNSGQIYLRIAQTEKESGLQKAYITISIEYLKKAIELCNEIEFKGPLVEFNEKLSEAYALSGNSSLALEAYKNFITNRDLIQSKEIDAKIEAIELKRKLQLKDNELLLKNQQIQISTLESINEKNKIIILLFGMVLLVSAMLLMALKFRSKRRKQNNLLKEIAWQQSHRVRSPVANILGLISLIDENKPDHPENKELLTYIKSEAIVLDQIIKNIVNKTKEDK